MIDKVAFVTSIAGKINTLLTGEKGPFREDMEKNIKAILHSAFARMELLTRDEFDAQVVVLQRTRQMLEALEDRVTGLEKVQASAEESTVMSTDNESPHQS